MLKRDVSTRVPAEATICTRPMMMVQISGARLEPVFLKMSYGNQSPVCSDRLGKARSSRTAWGCMGQTTGALTCA